MNILTISTRTRRGLAVLAAAASLAVTAGLPASAEAGKTLDLLCAQPYQTPLMRALLSVPNTRATSLAHETKKGAHLYWTALKNQTVDEINSTIRGDWDMRLTTDEDGNARVTNPEGKAFDTLNITRMAAPVKTTSMGPLMERRVPTYYLNSTQVPGRSYTLKVTVRRNDPTILYIRQAVTEDPASYTTLMFACTEAGDAD